MPLVSRYPVLPRMGLALRLQYWGVMLHALELCTQGPRMERLRPSTHCYLVNLLVMCDWQCLLLFLLHGRVLPLARDHQGYSQKGRSESTKPRNGSSFRRELHRFRGRLWGFISFRATTSVETSPRELYLARLLVFVGLLARVHSSICRLWCRTCAPLTAYATDKHVLRCA